MLTAMTFIKLAVECRMVITIVITKFYGCVALFSNNHPLSVIVHFGASDGVTEGTGYACIQWAEVPTSSID